MATASIVTNGAMAAENAPPASSAARAGKRLQRGATPHERLSTVIPAKAGIHFSAVRKSDAWVPAFAGTTLVACPRTQLDSSNDLRGQRDLLHPARRGGADRASVGVLPLLRLQSVVRARGGPGR